MRFWGLSTPRRLSKQFFFSNWNFLQNNTRSWVFAQQQYSFRFNTNELSTNKHVNKSGYTTEYRLKVSLERHYCSVLETEIRVWREVINHNQSTYTSHLAPDNSQLPHYSPLCSHTVPGLTNILINFYLWTRKNLNKICYAQPLF